MFWLHIKGIVHSPLESLEQKPLSGAAFGEGPSRGICLSHKPVTGGVVFKGRLGLYLAPWRPFGKPPLILFGCFLTLELPVGLVLVQIPGRWHLLEAQLFQQSAIQDL